MDLLPDDVQPVLGDEAKQYQSVIVEGVGKQFGGDESRLHDFVMKTRDYGKGDLPANEFWAYLEAAFTEPRALVFLPKLARLVPDGDRRRQLLKAPRLAKILRHNETLPVDAYVATEPGPTKFVDGPGYGRDGGVSGGGGGDGNENTSGHGSGVPPPPPTEAAAEPNPFAADDGAVGAVLSKDGEQVKEMFPDLPNPAIFAALQKWPVGLVIEKALGGQIDPTAVPAVSAAPPLPPPKPRGGKVLSGKTVRVGQALALSKFPCDALPSQMLPRDLARLQDMFPTAPTSLLQAELQVTGSSQLSMDSLMADQVHAEVLALDPVPVALRGYLVKSDPQGRNFTRRFFILRQLTGSLCYAKLPEDMDDPLGVVYLFNSRLSPAPLDAKEACGSRFSAADANSGFSLITPHRTYYLFAESAEEAAAWKTVLQQMAMLMVPPEFENGDNVVECEVFENETYGVVHGWGPPLTSVTRLRYSNRKGELSSAEFPEVKLPGDFEWTDEWHIDKTYTTTDGDGGWSYGGTFAALESALERGESSGVNATFDMARRRRWARTSQRSEGSARRLGEDAEHVVDFTAPVAGEESAFGGGGGGGQGFGAFSPGEEDDPFGGDGGL